MYASTLLASVPARGTRTLAILREASQHAHHLGPEEHQQPEQEREHGHERQAPEHLLSPSSVIQTRRRYRAIVNVENTAVIAAIQRSA